VSEAAVRQRVREIIAEVAEVPLSEVPERSSFFRELGLDSLKVVAIAVEIRSLLGVALPRSAEGVRKLDSVDELVR
jgi:acyl carrier protein